MLSQGDSDMQDSTFRSASPQKLPLGANVKCCDRRIEAAAFGLIGKCQLPKICLGPVQ